MQDYSSDLLTKKYKIQQMKKNTLLLIACFVFALLLMAGGSKGQASPKLMQTWYFSPIPAIGVGPNGLPTKKINITPYCCPSEAIEIKAPAGATDNDLQWVNIPLSLPGNYTITAVKVCYASSGNAYISQTRLTTMGTPDHATVVLDDPADRTAPGPVCYIVPANAKVDGTITLSLRVVVPQNGSLRIGSIAISLK